MPQPAGGVFQITGEESGGPPALLVLLQPDTTVSDQHRAQQPLIFTLIQSHTVVSGQSPPPQLTNPKGFEWAVVKVSGVRVLVRLFLFFCVEHLVNAYPEGSSLSIAAPPSLCSSAS